MEPSFWNSLSPGVQFLLEIGARGALLLAVAWVLYTLLLRRAPAAHRHALLVLSAAGLVLMLAVQALAPPLYLRLLAAPDAESAQGPAPRVLAGAPGVAVDRDAVEARSLMDGMDDMDGAAGAAQGSAHGPWEKFISAVPASLRAAPVLTLYLLVFLVLLAQLGAAVLGLRRLRRGAQPAPEYLLAVFEETWKRHSGQRGKDAASTRVRLCVGEAPVPMTWGWRRPVIMLPAASAEWDEERLRVVFLHELAHIHRADFLTLLLTRVAVALHWPNPLAWWLLRAVRRESEAACDEAVLRSGVRASDYAAHLLGVVKALRTAPRQRTASVAMAHTPHIAQRLEHICAVHERPRRSGWKTLLPAGLLLGGCLALAAPIVLEARAAREQPSTAFGSTFGGPGEQQPTAGLEPYSVTFPDAVTVTLLGIRRQGEDQWMHPNGTPLETPPPHSGGGSAHGSAGTVAYEAAFQVEPLEGTPFPLFPRIVPVLPEGAAGAGAGGGGGGGGGGSGPDRIMLMSLAFTLPEHLRELTLQVSYPGDDWHIVYEQALWHGGGGGGSRVGSGAAVVFISEAFESEDGFSVVVSDNTGEARVRLRARLRDETLVQGHSAGGGGSDLLRQTTYRFPGIAPTDVAAFQLEAAVELVGEIRNVRLRPPGEALSEEVSAEEGLQHLGLALKKYTLESRGGRFPPKAAGLPGFAVDWQALDPYLDDELRQFKESATAQRLVYLGHLVQGEDDLRALLDAYLEKGEEAVRAQDLRIGAPDTPGRIFRLREGIERFFITDINNPAASAVQQHTIPVAWVWPESGRNGGFVLYMDGLVRGLSWGAFPMTDAAVAAFKEFEAARK